MDFKTAPSPSISSSRDLVVLVSPSLTDPYYKPHFTQLLNFYTEFALKLIARENLILICDKATAPHFSALPQDVLHINNVYDIWV